MSAMAFQTWPKLSLLAQYDDLCRDEKMLTCGCEEEFRTFVEIQTRLWKEMESEKKQMNEKMYCLQSENWQLKNKLRHVEDLNSQERQKRHNIELQYNHLARKLNTQQILFDLVRKLLFSKNGEIDSETKKQLELFINSNKISSPPCLKIIEECTELMSDIDVTESLSGIDETEDYESRRKQRKSGKRKDKKSLDKAHINNERKINSAPLKTVTVHFSGEHMPATYDSETIYPSDAISGSIQSRKLPNNFQRSTSAPLCGSTPISRYSTSDKLSRQHAFISKVLCRPEKCNPCQRNIRIFSQILKCQDCSITCHTECKEKCPVPCVPIVHSPTKNTPCTIGEYTSSVAPMIPALIVHCVNEIESRGLEEKDLYCAVGEEREVKILKEKFLNGRSIPFMNKYGIHAICSTIKEFLKSLSEPMITRSAWQEFADAADLELNNMSLQVMYNIVASLPQPNQDTLAFLILHLQRVVRSYKCNMSFSSIAKIFGPVIVGFSVSDLAETNILRETKEQYKIMERFLSIAPDLWNRLLNFESDVCTNSVIKTPESIPAPKGTRLGPILPSDQNTEHIDYNVTPLTSRNSESNKSKKISWSS